MPGVGETFAQFAPQQGQGPFSQYLNPSAPAQAPEMPAATGWESHPHAVAAADIALGFLRGIRENRIRQFAQNEQQAQQSMDNYRQEVNARLQDPNLTDAGRQALLAQANATMAAHSQFEAKDAPSEGVGGFFKNLLVHATGGPQKSRKPIDFDTETGNIAKLINTGTDPATGLSYNQSQNFGKAVNTAQQAVDMLKRGDPTNGIAANPNPTAEQVQQAVAKSGAFQMVTTGAPKYINEFMAQVGVPMGVSYPAAGSPQALMSQLAPPSTTAAVASVPPTQAPPITAGYKLAARDVAQASEIPAQPNTATPSASVRPADTTTPANTIQYESGYGADRFAILSRLAHMTGGGVGMTAAHPVVTDSGVRTTGVMVSGSPNPVDNGYWDANSGQKISGRVIPVSLNPGSHVVRKGTDNMALVYDPNVGHEVYDLGPDGKPYKIPENFVQVTQPNGDVVWMSKSQAEGKVTGAQGLLQRNIEARRNLVAMGINAVDARTAHQDLINMSTRYTQSQAAINTKFDSLVDAARKGQLNITTAAAAGLNRPITQQMIDQARTNSQPLVDEIQAQRKEQLSQVQQGFEAVKQEVYSAYPELTGQPLTRTAPPPKAPFAKAKPAPAAPASTPPANVAPQGKATTPGKVVGLGDLK